MLENEDIDSLDEELEEEFDFGDDDLIQEEEIPEVVEKKEPVVIDDGELVRIRKERDDWLSEKETLTKARNDAELAAYNTEQNAVRGALNQWSSEIKREKSALTDLTISLKEAEINQDVEAVKRFSRAIADKTDVIENLSGEIQKYSPILNKQAPTPHVSVKAEKPAEVDQAKVMLQKWYAENSWYDDPKDSVKREKAETIYKDLIAKGYNPAGLKFWAHIDRELDKVDTKPSEKRRTPPAARPVSNNAGLSSVSNKQKIDADIKAATYARLKKRGITEDHPNFKKLRASYYASEKEFSRQDKSNNG